MVTELTIECTTVARPAMPAGRRDPLTCRRIATARVVFAGECVPEIDMTDTDRPKIGHDEGGTAVAPDKPKTKKPPLYKVVMHNDDYTPMEFVVEMLMTYFTHDRDKAVQIMLTVHTRGKAVAGTYTAQIAETKVQLVNDHARAHQHPLLCTMEEA